MIQIMIWVVVGLSAFNLVLLVLVLKRLRREKDDAEDAVPDELRSLREEVSRAEGEIRNEIRASQETTANTLVTNIGEFSKTLTAQVEGMRNTVNERFQGLQRSNDNKLEQIRQTVTDQLQSTVDTLGEVNTVGELGKSQDSQLARTSGKRFMKDLKPCRLAMRKSRNRCIRRLPTNSKVQLTLL